VIFDFHTHVDEVPALGWHMPVELVLQQMDEAGVDRAVIMTIVDAPAVNPNALELLAEIVAAHEKRLVGFLRVHPWYYEEAAAMIRHGVRDLNIRGVKLHPTSNLSAPGGDATVNIVRLAAECGVPVMFHSGDEALVTPWELAQCAKVCPDATIVFAHSGGYAHTNDAFDVAERYSNIMLDTSAMPYPRKLQEAVRRLGPERILFASDAPGALPSIELAKIDCAELSDDERRLVLGGNAMKLLGMAL